MPSDSWTEDKTLVEQFEQRKQKKKQEQRVIEKIETLQDRKEKFTTRELEELGKIESARNYYRKIRLAAEDTFQKTKADLEAKISAIESKIEGARRTADSSISYADEMIKKQDEREINFKRAIDRQLGRAEKKKETLVNTIETPTLKKQAEALLEKKPETESEPEPEPKSEPESESEEEAPPPPRIFKMKPKQVGVKSQGQQNPKIITNTKRVLAEDHQQEQEEYAKRDEAKSKESKLGDLMTKIRIAKNQLVTLERQVNRDEDKIREKEVEVNSLKEEYKFLESSIPAPYRR